MMLARACRAKKPGLLSATWAGLFALGCGAAAAPAKPGPPLDLGIVRHGTGGPDLAVIARPSAPIVQLSVWIDAGARDADPPQVATLAAWLAADAGGTDVEGRVWPDAVELSLPCTAGQLRACLTRLARGLALREAKPAQLAAARQRLVEARRSTAAIDPQRGADRLALQALYAEPMAGLSPLGGAERDAEVSPERVSRFLAQHFGLGRVLLVGAGNLETSALAEAASATFARVPAAQTARAERREAPSPRGGVAVGVDDKPCLSVAIAGSDLAAAHSIAAALEERLERDALATDVHGHAFLVRGSALALLRVQTREPLAAVRAVAHELARLRREGVPSRPAAPSSEDLPALVRRLGTHWAAGEPARSTPLAVGMGVVVNGGRGDRVRSDDPDAALEHSWLERAEAAWQDGLAIGDPHTTGERDGQTASVVLDNGARIELRQRSADQVAVAVRFARGANAEPPALHGRAALLATLTTTACAGLAPTELSARLQAFGARLEPRVDAESWGLLLTAPGHSWQAALALALDCALHPALERPALTAARLLLRERLGPLLGPIELRARAAEILWPAAPGELAPWGSPLRQAGVSLPALRELWVESDRGAAVAIAAVGPLPVQDAIGWAARRLSQLPGKPALADPKTRALPAPVRIETRPVDQPTFGLALWRTAMQGGDPAGAQAFAALMRADLGRATGVSASWHEGGLTTEGGWAAVALGGPAEQLAIVSARLHEAAASLSPQSLERASDQAFELAERSKAQIATSPKTEAETLARAPFRAHQAVGNRDAARAMAARLAQAEPIWLPLK